MTPEQTADPTAQRDPTALLLQGLLFGLCFGFLLQKGGVAKYEVLMGVLLFEDWTVIQVILSAVLVGMIGVALLHRFGLVKRHLRPTQWASNVIGGLVFGVGFGLSGYCPGTGAAALGQGNFDAIAVILGLIAGSHLFAETSGWVERTIKTWGKEREVTLAEVFSVRRLPFIAVFAVILALALLGLRVLPTL